MPAPIRHPVFAAMPVDAPRPRRPGLFVCRHPKAPPFTVRDGLRVATAAETLLAAARDLGVLDLAIMADSALRLGHCTLADLRWTAAQHRRGGPTLRKVIPLLDQRSESAWESVLRVLHLAAGIPVTPQYEIRDDAGAFIARADLRIDGTNRVHEYDGAVHRDGETHASDLARDRALLRAGWQRFGFTSHSLTDEGRAIIADVDRLLGRAWDPRRLHAWRELVECSLLGRTGRARAYRNWRRTEPEPPPPETGRRLQPGPV